MEILEIGLALEIFSAILALILFASLLKKYLQIPNIATFWIALFALLHGVNNLTWFVSDFPTIESLAIAIIGYLTYGIIPLFGIFFTTEVLNYRKKEIDAISLIIVSTFVILNFVYPPVRVFIEGIGFWIPSEISFPFYIPIMAMSFIPPILFIFFTLKTRSKRGILLALGFLFPAIFESVLEANMLLPLCITNLFEASGLLLIYFAYITAQSAK